MWSGFELVDRHICRSLCRQLPVSAPVSAPARAAVIRHGRPGALVLFITEVKVRASVWFRRNFTEVNLRMRVRVMHSYSFTEARISIRVRFRARVRRGLGFGTGLSNGPTAHYLTLV